MGFGGLLNSCQLRVLLQGVCQACLSNFAFACQEMGVLHTHVAHLHDHLVGPPAFVDIGMASFAVYSCCLYVSAEKNKIYIHLHIY